MPAAEAGLRHGPLAAFEHADMPNLESHPLLLSGPRREVVAAAPGYWYDLDLAARFPTGAGVLAMVRRAIPELFMTRTFEIGTPCPLTSPFMVRGGVDAHAAVRALGEAALEEAWRHGARFVLVQNMTSPECDEARELRALGFSSIEILPTAVLDLPYESFDGYVSAMRAPYRRKLQLAYRRSAGLRVERRWDFADLADELAWLWRQVYERATELRREVLPPSYFKAMSAVEQSSVLLLHRSDGTIASFALLLGEHPFMAFGHCGFESRAGREEGAYFRLLYEIVRVSIEGGYRQLDLGMTTLPPKLDLGAVPVPQYALVKHRNPIVDRLIRSVAVGPFGPPQCEPRNVFKTPAPTADELVLRREAIRQAAA